MNYVVKYKPIEDSVVLIYKDDPKKTKKIILKGKNKKEKAKGFLDKPKAKKKIGKTVYKKDFLQSLSSEDILWIELGGGADKFCLAAARKGVSVFRLPPHYVKEELDKLEKDDRQNPEDILLTFAVNSPDKFYPWRAIDDRIARIRILDQTYDMVQRRMRIAMENRLRSLNQDIELLEESDHSLSEELESLYRSAVHPEYLKRIETRIKANLKKTLKDFVLYEALGLDKIKGCAEGISAKIIGRIVDIRRFKTEAKLKAFAGWHLVKDKEGNWRMFKKQKGQRANRDAPLRTALYMFADEMEKQDLTHPWKQALNQRKEIEKQRHPDFAPWQIQRRSKRWLIQRFIHHIWVNWREFEGISEEVKV